MPDYRRAFVPGGTFFLTVCTHLRCPIFADPCRVDDLRSVLRGVMSERPFHVAAGVVLPDHVHWLWAMPPEDSDFSWRIGRVKALFTRRLRAAGVVTLQTPGSVSRDKHRDGDVWQRRFWEHTIRDDRDFERHLHYIHYNPVKHGLAKCPHAWAASSFRRWVALGTYGEDWCCSCAGEPATPPPQLDGIAEATGE